MSLFCESVLSKVFPQSFALKQTTLDNTIEVYWILPRVMPSAKVEVTDRRIPNFLCLFK